MLMTFVMIQWLPFCKNNSNSVISTAHGNSNNSSFILEQSLFELLKGINSIGMVIELKRVSDLNPISTAFLVT